MLSLSFPINNLIISDPLFRFSVFATYVLDIVTTIIVLNHYNDQKGSVGESGLQPYRLNLYRSFKPESQQSHTKIHGSILPVY